MIAKLYLETGSQPDRPIRIPDHPKTVTIGRGPDNFLRLDDDRCSRRHISLTRRFGKYVLRDLNSRGGTFVNDAAVRKAALRTNDRIRIGRSVLRFVVDTIDPYTHQPVAPLETLPEDRVSILCIISLVLGVSGLFWWLLAAAALVLGSLSALNVRLRPKLRGMWLGVAGASLGGLSVSWLVLGALVAAPRTEWSSATLKIECRRRLAKISDALGSCRRDHAGAPRNLSDLHPKYLKDRDALYCPALEKALGARSAGAAFLYSPANASLLPTGRWVVRDRDIDAHGDGGNVLFAGDEVRWLDPYAFIQATSEATP